MFKYTSIFKVIYSPKDLAIDGSLSIGIICCKSHIPSEWFLTDLKDFRSFYGKNGQYKYLISSISVGTEELEEKDQAIKKYFIKYFAGTL